MRRSLWLAALAVQFLAGPLLAGTVHAGGTAGLKWQAWDPGMRAAVKAERPVLVDVYTDWCGWCRRMDRDVYTRDDVRDYLSRHFVIVRLDAEAADEASSEGRMYTSRSLAGRFRVTGYPTTIFLRSGSAILDQNGSPVQNPPTLQSYQKATSPYFP